MAKKVSADGAKSAAKADGGGKSGKGKPPLHTRWGPGQSGNPSGKRKPQKVGDIIAKQLATTTTVTLEGKPTRLTYLELIVAQLTRKAAGGDLPAIKVLIGEAVLIAKDEPPSEPVMSDHQFEMLKHLVAAAEFAAGVNQ